MKVKDTEEKLDDAKKKQATLKSQLAENAAQLEAMKAGYAEKVRSGAGESELDALDAALYKTERAKARVEIRLEQVAAEIENLFHEREQAHREAERAKYDEDAAAAIAEAVEIEALVQQLMSHAGAHWKRVQRMAEFCKTAGVQAPFKLANLERRVDAVFRNGSLHKIYEQPYPKILESNLRAVELQLKRQAPEQPEAAPAEATTEAEASRNDQSVSNTTM
jgi:chromosome segregation ATPase